MRKIEDEREFQMIESQIPVKLSKESGKVHGGLYIQPERCSPKNQRISHPPRISPKNYCSSYTKPQIAGISPITLSKPHDKNSQRFSPKIDSSRVQSNYFSPNLSPQGRMSSDFLPGFEPTADEFFNDLLPTKDIFSLPPNDSFERRNSIDDLLKRFIESA